MSTQNPSLPPEAWRPLVELAARARRPVNRFLQIQATSGVVLLVTGVIAMLWANSRWAASYHALWQTPIGFSLGSLTVSQTLGWWVNDGLMAIFFFVVGLEIRREVHQGELSEWRRAVLPIAAALGGMVVPATLYWLVAGAPETRSGWGVPMATDIAFAVGVLALLGPRVPAALRVLLLALAVIDDLGAILVIALFYTSKLSLWAGGVAVLGVAGILVFQWLGVRSKWLYVLPAVVAWGGIAAFGVHPTIAGVIVGLLTPVRAWQGRDGFVEIVRGQLGKLGSLEGHALFERLQVIDEARREATSPAESLIERLHPWVAYGIMPIFALANAGVTLSGGEGAPGGSAAMLGVVLGLVVGKPVGVVLACWLVQRVGLGTLPVGLGLRHLVVLGAVAGIGFTMSLFIAQLAFVDEALLNAAKGGVLLASVVAGVLGVGLGVLLLRPQPVDGAAVDPHEAERSTAQ